MKIRRVILKNVRNFKDFDRDFEDSWTGEVPDSLLLIGPNGTGKSTLLNTIAGLWQILYNFLEEDERIPDETQNTTSGSTTFTQTSGSPGNSSNQSKIPDRRFIDLLSNSRLAAMQVQGFLDAPNFWLFAGNDSDLLERFIFENNSELRIGRLYTKEKGSDITYATDAFYQPDSIEAQVTDAIDAYPSWFSSWQEKLVHNVYSSRHDLPNIVYLESETRILQPIKNLGGLTPEPDEFQWLARYEPSTSRKGSLQNYLFAQKAVNLPLFEDIRHQINLFLNGKQLADISPKTYQIMVDVKGQKHPIDELSSGEKQVLLMLVTVIRRLEEGGIVMIDEPDLHLHVSMVNAFVGHLRKMIGEKKGQLILASHAPELWRMHKESQTVNLGEPGGDENL